MIDQQKTKLRNRSTVLSLVRSVPGISQSELAVRTGLQPSTVSYAVRELRDRELVLSIGHKAPSPNGGKRPVELAPNGASGTFLGLSVRRGRVDQALVDFAGLETVPDRTVSVSTARGIERHLVAAVERAVNGPAPLLGVGIAIASVVDRLGAVHASAAFPHSLGDLASRVREAVGLADEIPLVIENDANCAALTVARPGVTSLAFVISSAPATIGAGLAIDGELYRGARNSAGELFAPDAPDTSAAAVDLLASVIRFADPDTVLFVHDDLSSAEGLVAGDHLPPDLAIHHDEYPGAPLTGAVEFAYARALPGLIGFSESGGRK